MKIIIVNKHFSNNPGGSEFQCHLIANELKKKNFAPEYLCIENSKKSKKLNVKYKIHNVGKSIFKIINLILKLKPNIIYWRYNTNLVVPVLFLSKLMNIPIIFAVSSFKDIQSNSIYSKLINLFNHVTVNNKKFLRYLKFKNKSYIPNITTIKFKKFVYKKKFVLWISNIKKRKNIELYTEIAKKYEHKNIYFLCVGEIQDSSYNWIKRFNLKCKNFKYLGFKSPEEINGILKKTLLHITTEDHLKAGFSNTFIQSCFQKKPTLSFSFDPGGFIKSKKIGRYCDQSKKKFFDDFDFYLKNPNERRKDGKKAFKFAKKEFNKNTILNKLIKIFQKITI